MPETINWSFSVEAVNGPRISGSDAFDVDAYDKVSVVLAADPNKHVDVQVQPAHAAGKVHLLVIRASTYHASITFSTAPGTGTAPGTAPGIPPGTGTGDTGSTTFSLDGPVVLIGSGAVKLLSSTPQTLEFTNGTSAAVTVDILVGRDSTP